MNANSWYFGGPSDYSREKKNDREKKGRERELSVDEQ